MTGASPPLTHLAARVLSIDPLVTFSTTNRAAPLGLMSIVPELLGGRPGLHLLNHTWTLENGDAAWLSASVSRARNQYPDAHFVMLTATELEAEIYGRSGESCILANTLCLLDETVWRPTRALDGRSFDAVYVARLDGVKRHALAKLVPRLELIYGYELESDGAGYQRTRAALPHAYFVNHEMGGGSYRMLAAQDVVQHLENARVGLCLSAVEGNMRASMEYLLSGLPVVSTRSKGGRDRYFGTNYCRIVSDDAEEVAASVAQLVDLRLDPLRIRQHVLQIVGFERHNLISAVNGLTLRYLGHANTFADASAFIGATASVRRSDEIGLALQRQFGGVRDRGVPAKSVTMARGREPAFAAIVAKPRSGTHLLRSFLSQIASVDPVGEAFNPEMQRHLPRHFATYLFEEARLRPSLPLSAWSAARLLDRYFEFLRQYSAGQRTVVVDVKDDSLRVVDWPMTGFDEMPLLLRQMMRKNFRVLRLRRRNLLAQIASFERAKLTNEWVRSDPEARPEEEPRLTLSPESLVTRFEQMLNEERRLDLWLESCLPLELYYEDLVNPDDGVLQEPARRQLEEFLGTKVPAGLTPKTVKIAPPIAELIDNFEEIRAALRGTPYETFTASTG